MKILILSDRYPPYYEGGYELCCEAKAQGLERDGHEVFVLTSTYGVAERRNERSVFRLLHSLNPEGESSLARRCRQLTNSFLGRLNADLTRMVITAVKPDVIYIWRMGHVSLFPVIVAVAAPVPVVFELQDYWLSRYVRHIAPGTGTLKSLCRQLLYGKCCRRLLDARHLITVSAAMKRHYVDLGFGDERIVVIHNGIDEALIDKAAATAPCRREGDMRLLYAGRLVREKGVETAIAAIGHLVRELGLTTVTLELIGSGPQGYLRHLQQLVDGAGLQRHVRLCAALSREELLAAYGNYDAFIFPSVWEEPFGLTIIEAMARGVPVIASRVGGVPEIVSDGDNGLLVGPGDHLQLAAAIKRLADDPLLTAALSSRGQRAVRDRFTSQRAISRTRSYLAAVADGYTAPGGRS